MLPIGSWPLQSSLLWQSWNFLIIVFLLMAIEPFLIDKKRLALVPIIIVLLCSTPGSIVFLPWFLLRCLLLWQKKAFNRLVTYALLCAAIIMYAVWGMNALGSYYTAVRLHLNEIIRVGLLTSLPRVMLEGFSSLSFRMTIHDISPVISLLLSLLIFIIICIAAFTASKKNSCISELALYVGYFIISMTTLSIIRLPLHDYVTFSEKGFRYFYVQKYVILLLFLICSYQLIVFLSTKIKLLLTLIAFVLVISFFVSDNYRFCIADYSTYAEYKKKKANSEKLISLREEGIKLAECLSRAQQERTAMKLSNRRESQISCEEYFIPFDMDLINKKE
jgi:hypothetical protein